MITRQEKRRQSGKFAFGGEGGASITRIGHEEK